MGRSERDENTQIDRETKSSGHELILRERVLAAGRGAPRGKREERRGNCVNDDFRAVSYFLANKEVCYATCVTKENKQDSSNC